MRAACKWTNWYTHSFIRLDLVLKKILEIRKRVKLNNLYWKSMPIYFLFEKGLTLTWEARTFAMKSGNTYISFCTQFKEVVYFLYWGEFVKQITDVLRLAASWVAAAKYNNIPKYYLISRKETQQVCLTFWKLACILYLFLFQVVLMICRIVNQCNRIHKHRNWGKAYNGISLHTHKKERVT